VGTLRRVVLLGRGGAGKSTAARQLSGVLGVPLIELDARFWSAALEPTSPERWEALQEEWAAAGSWVMDGDLGPYDVLAPRLCRADTVIVLDFSLPRCLWRAARRSRERLDFWWWVITWRRVSRPKLLAAVSAHAPQADLHVLRSPAQLTRFMTDLDAGHRATPR